MASFFTFPHRWSPYQEMNLNLVGRETDLVGRETGAPQRIWDSSIFTGRVGRYTMCCYVSPSEPPRLQLPAPCGGESVAHPGALVFVCGLPMSSGLEVSKHEKHAVNSMRCCPLLHGSAWRCRGCLPLSLACSLLAQQNSLKASSRKKKRTSFKRKASKRGTEVSLSERCKSAEAAWPWGSGPHLFLRRCLLHSLCPLFPSTYIRIPPVPNPPTCPSISQISPAMSE